MDEIDKKILQMLQENARYSLKKIAESTFLSSPAVSSRIGKLEREDIITGYHAAVDPAPSSSLSFFFFFKFTSRLTFAFDVLVIISFSS